MGEDVTWLSDFCISCFSPDVPSFPFSPLLVRVSPLVPASLLFVRCCARCTAFAFLYRVSHLVVVFFIFFCAIYQIFGITCHLSSSKLLVVLCLFSQRCFGCCSLGVDIFV